MGFTFRKRGKGINISLSRRGLRISTSLKSGGITGNIGHYFGGEWDGKTTGRANVNFGNGVEYRKDVTLSSSNDVQQRRTNSALDQRFLTETTTNESSDQGFKFLDQKFTIALAVLAWIYFIVSSKLEWQSKIHSYMFFGAVSTYTTMTFIGFITDSNRFSWYRETGAFLPIFFFVNLVMTAIVFSGLISML